MTLITGVDASGLVSKLRRLDVLFSSKIFLPIYTEPGKGHFFSFLSCLNNLLCCINNLIILFAQDNYLVKTT